MLSIASKANDIAKAVEYVSIATEKSREQLNKESEKLINVSKTALTAANDAAGIFTKQSTSLFKAAQDAQENIDKIKNTHWKVQRDAFMNSAKFIVESLHSLSMDLTTTLEGGVPDKTWKLFQKGDVAAFTRRLAQLGTEKMPIDKLRKKYCEDSDFRGYVQRYVRQFEELFDQASNNDHGEILASTFMSSEVGKLYEILCSASGKEPRTVKRIA